MLRINIHKNGDRLYEVNSNKTYLWEGDQISKTLTYLRARGKNCWKDWNGPRYRHVGLTFTDGNQVTMKTFRILVADESVTLDKYVKQ